MQVVGQWLLEGTFAEGAQVSQNLAHQGRGLEVPMQLRGPGEVAPN